VHETIYTVTLARIGSESSAVIFSSARLQEGDIQGDDGKWLA
jgi:hypothetical protein